MMRNTLSIVVILTLLRSGLSAITKADPNLSGKSYLIDQRDVNRSLLTREDVESDVASNQGYIDLSPAAAARRFRELMGMNQLEGERNMRMKYVLHNNVGQDAGSNRLLEEWALINENNGLYRIIVLLRMLDLNNTRLENGIKENVFEYTCKYYKPQDIAICKPEKCDFMNVTPPTDPVQICVNNYHQSQMVLDTVRVSSQTQKPQNVGEELQNLIVHCIEQHIENLTVHGETICYYKGFEPENIVSFKDMRKKILAEPGWMETDEAGTFRRTTTVKEWEIVSHIDTSIPALLKENSKVLKNLDPATLTNILDQVDSAAVDKSGAIVLEAGTP